jgi:hypothetical protein
MATTTATGGVKNNDSGRVVQGGNITSGRFATLAVRDTVSNSDKNGTVTESTTLGNIKANSGRTFAKTNAGQYIILTYTKFLGGVADTTLDTPAQGRTPDFPKIETAKTGFLRAMSWTSLNVDAPAYTFTQSPKTLSMGTDNAAVTTHRITYLQNGTTPTTNTDRDY